MAQLLWVVASLGVLVFPFALRRYRLLGYLIVANLAASALTNAAIEFVDQEQPKRIANDLAARAGVHLGSSITATGIAILAASFVLLGPFLGSRWRQAGALLLAAFVAMRVVLSVELPGRGVPGARHRRRGRCRHVARVRSTRPAPVGRHRGRQPRQCRDHRLRPRRADPWEGRVRASSSPPSTTARQLLVKVRSPAERSADLLFRFYRWLRLKNVGDERPFISLRRAVEHEALVSLQARDVGVRTPRLRAIAEVGADSMLVAYDRVDGETLETLDPDAVDDALLRAVWEQLRVLRTHRIAHRDLRRSNIVVDESGEPWLVDFGFSEVAVVEARLDTDVAQLLAALSLSVGAARAVDSAIAVLGVEPVRLSLHLLQLNALSGATPQRGATPQGSAQGAAAARSPSGAASTSRSSPRSPASTGARCSRW